MAYTALPDRRIPYDNDGTVLGYSVPTWGATEASEIANGVVLWMTGADMIEWNDPDYVGLSSANMSLDGGVGRNAQAIWLFMPEQREVTAAYAGLNVVTAADGSNLGLFYGSNDTTNGVDGTWEAASWSSGVGSGAKSLDGWRRGIKPLSFTGGKKAIRFTQHLDVSASITTLHVYGEKQAGQTPDDVIFINHDDTPGVEFTAPEDFGDQPLGTTVVRQFRLKNVSGTKTANTINVQCNDSDFAISENGSTWVVTINITSLSAGAESATLYVRCTTPAVGALLGPRFARIVVTVASYT